jgi:ABC-type Na+ efflux pump permease subunit
MNEPAVSERLTASHLAARCSIIAALACFVGNWLMNRLSLSMGWTGANWLSWAVSVFTSGLLVLGVLLAGVGIVGGYRRKANDTVLVAVIGLTLNVSTILLMIWALKLLSDFQRLPVPVPPAG